MNNIIRKITCIMAGVIVLSTAPGCSTHKDVHPARIESLKLENEKLRSTISELQKTIDDYQVKETKHSNLVIAYTDVPDQVRFIAQEGLLLALPQAEATGLNKIWPNTLVTVMDRAVVNEQTWLFVQIPVYDTPANSKGWILEQETELYTKANKQQLQSDVGIRAGAEVYETYEFEDIKNTTPRILAAQDRGRLEEKKEGYCRFLQAGGNHIWVKENSIVYP